MEEARSPEPNQYSRRTVRESEPGAAPNMTFSQSSLADTGDDGGVDTEMKDLNANDIPLSQDRIPLAVTKERIDSSQCFEERCTMEAVACKNDRNALKVMGPEGKNVALQLCEYHTQDLRQHRTPVVGADGKELMACGRSHHLVGVEQFARGRKTCASCLARKGCALVRVKFERCTMAALASADAGARVSIEMRVELPAWVNVDEPVRLWMKTPEVQILEIPVHAIQVREDGSYDADLACCTNTEWFRFLAAQPDRQEFFVGVLTDDTNTEDPVQAHMTFQCCTPAAPTPRGKTPRSDAKQSASKRRRSAGAAGGAEVPSFNSPPRLLSPVAAQSRSGGVVQPFPYPAAQGGPTNVAIAGDDEADDNDDDDADEDDDNNNTPRVVEPPKIKHVPRRN